MTKFEGCYLTNAGCSMVYDSGLSSITFTKAVTGSGIYVSKDDISDMVELKEPRQEFGLDGFSKGENFTISIKFKINNVELNEGYQLSEIGIYARGDDGEEKLYCVAYAMSEYTEEIPESNGVITYYLVVDIETVISNNTEVSVVYSEEHEWAQYYVDKVIEQQEQKIKELHNNFKKLLESLMLPIVTEIEMKNYLSSETDKEKIDRFRVGQVVVAKKEVYTYIGDNPHNIECYCRCGHNSEDYFNIAIPFYLVFSCLNGEPADYDMVRAPEYDNVFNIAVGFYSAFHLVSGSIHDYSSGTIAYARNEYDIRPAFEYVFGRSIVEKFAALDTEKINKVTSSLWDGKGSENLYALLPEEIERTTSSLGDREGSRCPFALSASEIETILTLQQN